MSHPDLFDDFLQYAQTKLDQNLQQIVRCTTLLTPDEIWYRANAHTNAVGNLILHLAGNVRQWIVAGVGGRDFQRDRPAEFSARAPQPTEALVEALRATVQEACAVLARLDAATLATRRTIQGYEVSTLVAVVHVVEHFSFHTGQIVHVTKALRDVDLSLYDSQGRKHASSPQRP